MSDPQIIVQLDDLEPIAPEERTSSDLFPVLPSGGVLLRHETRASLLSNVNSAIAGKQSLSEKDAPNGYQGLDSDGKTPGTNVAGWDDKEDKSAKNQPNGYQGLDASGKTPAANIAGDSAHRFVTDSQIAAWDVAAAFAPHVGLILTWLSTTSFSCGTGVVGDDTHVSGMKMLSVLTKTTAAWAAGNGVGGLFSGAIANNTWYYVYVIKNPTTGAVDWGYDISPTAPSLPVGYTLKRMVGAVRTDGSGNIRPWVMLPNGEQIWKTMFSDLSATVGTSMTINSMTSVPPVVCYATVIMAFNNNSGAAGFFISGNTGTNDVALDGSIPNISCSMRTASVLYFLRESLSINEAKLLLKSSLAASSIFASSYSFNVRPFN